MRHGQFLAMTTEAVESAHPSGGNGAAADRGDYTLFFGTDGGRWPGLGDDTDEVLRSLSKSMEDRLSARKGDNPTIPAGYTYLAQFVVHDITHTSVAPRLNGPSGGTENLSTPTLDLDSVYGGGPERDFALYEPTRGNEYRYLLRTGVTREPVLGCDHFNEPGLPLDVARLTGPLSGIHGAQDNVSADALIADPRNDDHLILSQLHLEFILLHNRVAERLVANGHSGRKAYDDARRYVTGCFRDVVRNDLAKKLLTDAVYEDLLRDEPQFLKAPEGSVLDRDKTRVPLEFSMAVGRFGHSMIRSTYELNRCIKRTSEKSLETVLQFSGFSDQSILNNRRRLPVPSDWIVEWPRFFDMGVDPDELIPSRRINPFISFIISNWKPRLDTERDDGIGYLDLLRSSQCLLPSGQQLARQINRHADGAFEVPILGRDDFDLAALDHGQTQEVNDKIKSVFDSNPALFDATPLLFYVLWEAAVQSDGEKLGPVGSFILGFTFRRALPRQSGIGGDTTLDAAKFLSLRHRNDGDLLNDVMQALGS